MKRHPAPPSQVSPQIAELLQLAADLRELPRDTFKARLRDELIGEAQVGGKPLITYEDIMQRLVEIEHEPKLVPYDVRAALRGLPDSAMRFITPMDEWILNVSAGREHSHWEKHNGDELLYVIDGAADIKIATVDGLKTTRLESGSLFVCPDGLWHMLVPRGRVEAFYATPRDTEASDTKNPPRPPKPKRKPHKAKPQHYVAHDLNAILRDLPELRITDETTKEEADAAVHTIGAMGDRSLGVMRFSGPTPWERHGGDELLYVFEGGVDLTTLTDDGPVERRIEAGSFFVCPRGLWHRQAARPSAAILYGTPAKTSQHSFAEDPRLE